MSSGIDQAHYRTVLGHLPTSVVALCGADPVTAHPCGLVVGTFGSLSLDPPLVTFSVAHTSTSWPKVRATGRLCASVLATGQEAVCAALSKKDHDKFAAIDWHPSATGSPKIIGAHAWIDCELAHEFDGGDHAIVVARVLALEPGWGDPLVFHKGRLGGYRGPAAA